MGADLIYGRLVAATLADEKIVDAIVLAGTKQAGEPLFETGGSSADLDSGVLPAALRAGFEAAGIPLTEGLTSVRRLGRGWEVVDGITGQAFDIRATSGALSVSRGFYRANLATVDRKARLDPAHVDVVLMDELVALDAKVLLEPSPSAMTAIPPRVTPAVQQVIENAVREVLAQEGAQVRRSDIVEALRSVLSQEPGLGLQLAEGNAVTINAEFVETGRLLNATEEILLEENHLIELRRIDVSIPGPLDV
jgi:hypothetical protein